MFWSLPGGECARACLFVLSSWHVYVHLPLLRWFREFGCQEETGVSWFSFHSRHCSIQSEAGTLFLCEASVPGCSVGVYGKTPKSDPRLVGQVRVSVFPLSSWAYLSLVFANRRRCGCGDSRVATAPTRNARQCCVSLGICLFAWCL